MLVSMKAGVITIVVGVLGTVPLIFEKSKLICMILFKIGKKISLVNVH